MYNNYNNDNFNNGSNPLFSSGVANIPQNNNQTQQNPFENSVHDIPPVLEPIKELSNASIVSAPTLDSLGPMNIMPETFENPQSLGLDPLDAYDKGINYNSMVNSSINNEVVNPIPNTLVTSNEENSFQTNPISYEVPKEQNLTNNGILNLENNLISQPVSLESPNLVDNEHNILGINDSVLNSFSQDSLNTESNEVKNEPDVQIQTYENNLSNVSIESSIDSNKEDEESQKIPKVENNSYEIVQENIEKVNPMLNLGIDNAYDDIDMLDIVDFDEEKKEESNNPNTEEQKVEENNQEEKPLMLDSINEIKELINKIKENGIKVELEEFDFEHMYQLIVKIEK